MHHRRAAIVAIGGTTRPGSSTERALRHALAAMDADTVLFCGRDLDLPLYAPHQPARTPSVDRLIAQLRRADGMLIASPGHHGGMSGQADIQLTTMAREVMQFALLQQHASRLAADAECAV